MSNDAATDARGPESQSPVLNRRFPGVALVLQGGGARAAYQAGVLKALSEILDHPTENPFPIITGTSAGAINAAVLASYAGNFAESVKRLEEIWSMIEPSRVYRTDILGVVACSARWLSAFLFGAITGNHRVSLFDNSPLHDFLDASMDAKRIQANLDSGALRALAITASGYTSGQNCAFFQAAPDIQGWRRSQRVGIKVAEIKAEHLMASSAIPFAFPAVKINREYFGDGSIRQMAPVSPALHLGASRIFVIGTAKLVKDMPSRARSDVYPSLAQIAGHAMSSIFLDSLAMDLELLQRVNSTIALVDQERLKASGMPLHHVDFCVACPDTPLEGLAHKHVGNLPASIRFLMRSIGAMRAGGAVLASYLLFDKHYCRALIEMGYQNTIQRREELSFFFDPDARPVPIEIPIPKFHPDISQQFSVK